MKYIFTSDIHVSRNHLSTLLSVAGKNAVKCVIIGGDIVPHELPGEKRLGLVKAQAEYLSVEFIPAIKEFKERNPDTQIFLDMANDDLIWNRQILGKHEGDLFSLLHMKVQRLTEQVNIAGYMSVPITPFMIKDWEKPDTKEHPFPGAKASLNGYRSVTGMREKYRLNPSSDDTIERDLALLSEKITKPFVFVSHAPPYDTDLDVLSSKEHVGSRAVRDFIIRWAKDGRLIASFHGHIHESPNVTGSMIAEMEGVPCINPGQGEGYRSAVQFALFDIEGTRITLVHLPTNSPEDT